MKQLKILKREILARTGYKKFPYKQVDQFIINYNNKNIFSENISIDNQNSYKNNKLKKPFEIIFKTTSIKKLNEYLEKNNFRSEAAKWLKNELIKIIEENKKV